MMYKIPEVNLPYFEKQAKQLQKTCIKLGLPVLAYKVTGEEVITKRIKGKDEKICMYFVELENAEAPKLAGWSFAATVSHEEAGNVFLTNKTLTEGVPARYREVGAVCEHCNTNRSRKNSYILLSEAGEWKQVGRSCLKDFLGHTSPEAIASYCEILFSLSETQDIEEDSWGIRPRTAYVEIMDALVQGARFMRKDGYISAKMAWDNSGRVSTADRVRTVIFDRMSREDEQELENTYGPVTDADKNTAAEAINWAKDLPEDAGNDYLWNLRVLANSTCCKVRSLGLAVSMLVAYDKSRLAKIEKETRVNEWYGTVGEKVSVSAIYNFHTSFETMYGLMHIHSFLVEGKELVWKTSKGLDLATGIRVMIQGKIKEHSTYKDKKQTLIERAKVTTE